MTKGASPEEGSGLAWRWAVHAFRAALGIIVILVCMAAGLVLPLLLSDGVSSRDFRPSAALAAVLIASSAAVLSKRCCFSWLDFILSMLVIEIFVFWKIASTTGMPLLCEFNLAWLLYLNLFTALPWVAGAGIGMFCQKQSN